MQIPIVQFPTYFLEGVFTTWKCLEIKYATHIRSNENKAPKSHTRNSRDNPQLVAKSAW